MKLPILTLPILLYSLGALALLIGIISLFVCCYRPRIRHAPTPKHTPGLVSQLSTAQGGPLRSAAGVPIATAVAERASGPGRSRNQGFDSIGEMPTAAPATAQTGEWVNPYPTSSFV